MTERLSWDRPERPEPASVSRRLEQDGMRPLAWSNGPHDRYAVHAHAYEKVLYCAAGSIKFEVGAPPTSVELRPGDGVRLPAGTPHSAVVGAAGCTCVEGHRAVSG